MNEIEIRDIQNIAQNMFVGSKQHALFNPVINNNPNLVSVNSVPEHNPVVVRSNENLEINISTDGGSQTLSIRSSLPQGNSNDPQGGFDFQNSAPKGLNSELYGILKPCKKQFNTGESSGMLVMNQDGTDHEGY